MKRIYPLVAAVALALAALACTKLIAKPMPPTPDSKGHVLTARWTEYEKAQRADRPQRQLEILEEIRTEAMRQHLAADFYDAASEYVEVAARRDWKQREPSRTEFADLVRQFDEPIVTYTWMGAYGGKSSDERWEYVREAGDAFAKGNHPEFWRYLGNYLGGALKEFVQNDREYVLWDLLMRRQMNSTEPDKDEVYAALRSEIGTRYPAWPTLRYFVAARLPDVTDAKNAVSPRQAALEALVADPSMGAVAFWPRQDLLQRHFSKLNREGGKSDDYKALLADCKKYQSDLAKLSGAEARIAKGCTAVQKLIETLNSKSLSVTTQKDSIIVHFRNLDRADVTVSTARSSFKQKMAVRNDQGSFYALDKVSLPLPKTDDDDYTIEAVNGKTSARASWRSHTLSLAHRLDAGGFAFYVTDYITGKPVDACRLILRKGDKIVATESVSPKGFTALPASMAQLLTNDRTYYYLQAELNEGGRMRRSEEISIGGYRGGVSQLSEDKFVNFYLDRGAYNPGDTLKFKAVFYKGDMIHTVAVIPNTSLEVQLLNAQGDELERKILKTNEFGSIAGDFFLPQGQRGGHFSLYVYQGKSIVGSRSFRVDEFVLPTFTLDFEPVEQLFLAHHEVEVRGKIRAYSGHNLSGATVTAQVLRYGEVISEQTLEPAADGAFSLVFNPEQNGYYDVTVKVVDATGETLDFSTGVYVVDRINLSVDVLNEADGEFVTFDERPSPTRRYAYRPNYVPRYLVSEDTLRVELTARNTNGDKVPVPVSYSLQDESGKVLASATVESGSVVVLSLPACALYDLKVTATVPEEELGDEQSCQILKVGPKDTVLDAPVRRVFLTEAAEIRSGEKIRVRMGSADGAEWAVVTMFSPKREVLDSRMITLAGERGKAGSLTTLEWDYLADWPEAVRLHIFYFKYGQAIEYDHEFHRVRTTLDLPLAFSSFTDKTQPGTELTFTLQSAPGVEAVAAVWDKSIDAIAPNYWPTVSLRFFTPMWVPYNSVTGSVTGVNPFDFGPRIEVPLPAGQAGRIVGVVVDETGEPLVGVSVTAEDGKTGTVTDPDGQFVLEVPVGTMLRLDYIGYESVTVPATAVMRVMLQEDKQLLLEETVVAYGVQTRGLARMNKSAATVDMMAMEAPMAANSAVMFDTVEDEAVEELGADVAVREQFEAALTFQPFLRSDADGRLSFTFKTSDKLSTYYVAVFAHDPAMRNAYVRNEMVVSTPVKVSVVEPKYLYAGDKYEIAVSVANSAGRDLTDGQVILELFASDDRTGTPFKTLAAPVALLADGATESVTYEIEADPSLVTSGVLGIEASYVSGAVSDGLFLTVPVRPARQILTEAHSAVLLAGMDKQALVDQLRAAFVNTSGEGAEYKEISIIDMVREALPAKVEPEADDVLSLSEAWYVRLVAGSLGVSFSPETPTEKLLERILACQNGDGGFAWFEGMKSSPMITAVLLERFAKIKALGLLPDLSGKTASAVKFLDRNQFDYEWPGWCGGLDISQYLFIRSYYASVPFEVKATGNTKVFNQRMKDFKKYVTDYLVPKKERGLTGQILAKARRLRTLQNLLDQEGGTSLAKAWGVTLGTTSRLRSSLQADALSLLEYAVDHRDGGMYYPNAVMPFRGLLESEAYAHAMLCDLLAGLPSADKIPAGEKVSPSGVADGIRLWLMLQKETQHWDTDPAFVDAIHSVMQGSDAVKQTQVILMKQTYEKPFEEIAAAGNGFTVARKFFRSVGVEEKYNDRTEDRNRTLLQWEEIRPGTVLKVGDRIRVEYQVWNAENRSFVKLSAPREAALRPVEQLSGHYGWGIGALRIDGGWSFMPQGYRDVKADHTDFYFDVYPEEKTTVAEEFFVTQAGVFTAPVTSIESLYAPHYRANDGFTAALKAQR